MSNSYLIDRILEMATISNLQSLIKKLAAKVPEDDLRRIVWDLEDARSEDEYRCPC